MLFLILPFQRPNSDFTHWLPDGLILTVLLWLATGLPCGHLTIGIQLCSPVWTQSQFRGMALCSDSFSLCLPFPKRTLSSLQLGAGTFHPWGILSDTAFRSAWASEHYSLGASPPPSLLTATVSTNHSHKPWPHMDTLLGTRPTDSAWGISLPTYFPCLLLSRKVYSRS